MHLKYQINVIIHVMRHISFEHNTDASIHMHVAIGVYGVIGRCVYAATCPTHYSSIGRSLCD